MATQDSRSEDLVLFTLNLTGESLFRVGDIKSSIGSTLHDCEDLGAGGGGLETDIEVDLEGSSFSNVVADIVVLSVVLVSFVQFCEADLVEKSSSEEETSGICSSIVGKTSVNSPFLEFLGISSTEDSVTLDGGVDDLGDDPVVGDSGHKSVLGGIVFVLVLEDESLAGEVVGLALSSSLEFGLEAHEIGFVLDELNEGHWWILNIY